MLLLIRIYILAWASALLVQTIRAMPEPLYVGRVTSRLPRFFFCISVSIKINFIKGSLVIILLVYGRNYLELHFSHKFMGEIG